MQDSIVLTEIDPRGVATITLNRPKVNNAYNSLMIQELLSAVQELVENELVRTIILRGNGRHFQAGADLNWINEVSKLTNDENLTVSQNTTDAVRFLNQCPKPTIALVHGACFGGGTGIVAACDIVIATINAFFSIAEVRWGLHAGPILPQLAAAIGTRNLRRFALTGESFDATQAWEIGLVHEVCEENELEDISDPLPHMLPSAEYFSLKMRKMGIGTGVKVIAYDTNGGFSASCRAWWMLRVFGHNDVAILNGGLPKWVAEQRIVENQSSVAIECDFKAHKNDFLIRDIEQMLANVDSRQQQVVDARSSGRFFGIDPEPRPSIKKGHIPGSLNLPYNLLMDATNNFVFRSADEISKAIELAGITPKKPLIATCGSGVTACVIALALYLVGYKETAVYDGSWAEWGDHPITPVDSG